MTSLDDAPREASLVLPFADPIGGYNEIRMLPWAISYLLDGRPHRLDGPAKRFGGMPGLWYRNGERHRLDGPAVVRRSYRTSAEKYRHIPPERSSDESPFGRLQWLERWYDDGYLSRVDGPALLWQDGTEEWFCRNRRHRIGLPAVIGADGLREWHHVSSDELTVETPRMGSIYVIQSDESYYRDHGPAVILGDGTRYWGAGSVGSYNRQRPGAGPWIEYVDGSVDFIEGDSTRNRAANHPSTVNLRRDGRHYVAATFGGPPCSWFERASFLPFVDRTEFFDFTWQRANLDDRRHYSAWALEQWERVQGNLSYDDERQLRGWLDRFKQTVDQHQEEMRMLRIDMQGYLSAAIRQLEEVPARSLDDLQSIVTRVGLPLTGVVAQLTPESRLLRAVVTAPTLEQAITPALVRAPTVRGQLASPKPRPPKIVNALYVNGIAELALATLAAIAHSDGVELADTLLLNVMVDDIDRTTGHTKRFCVLSVQVERSAFENLNLELVDPLECIKHLGAVVPRGTTELAPVRPIIAFDKADARIVPAVDVASRLDSRANLMELTPNEFESLIQNLFTKIGLDTHQTQASRDGGVDAIAYDSRPIFGGKIIIQAKRYKNTVGVSAVRDLYGTVMNEGASKGLLVTTSGYGKSSFEFAKNKPLELLEGGHLLHLLKEHLGMDAVIIPPITWADPIEAEGSD